MIFNLKQIEYIISNLNISKKLKANLIKNEKLTEEEYDEIYEMSADRLSTHGFDENYDINEEGKILEEIIDKLT